MNSHEYAQDFATTMTSVRTNLTKAAIQAIALDFDERMHDKNVRVAREGFFATEWDNYLADIGGYENFPSYAAALLVQFTSPLRVIVGDHTTPDTYYTPCICNGCRFCTPCCCTLP